VKLLAATLSLFAALASAPVRAHADDVVAYQADGDADAAAPEARVTALDEAFVKAVTQAVGEIVEPEARRQHKAAIDREVVGHARLWVARFTVTKETVTEDRKVVSASVRVDRDKLRARLAELGVPTRAAGDAGSPAGPTAAPLLRVAAPEGVRASYGLSAEKDVPGSAALAAALRRAGMAVKRAPASGPAARADGELPLDDDAAESLAAVAKAEIAAVVGVSIGAPVALRGVDARGVLVAARARLIDRKAHQALGDGRASAVALSPEAAAVAQAADRAVGSAVADAAPPPPEALAQAEAFTGDDRPVAAPGIVLVRLARATPWGLVQAELKHLAGARGVARVSVRHVSPAGWVLGVATSESIERIAAVVKKPPAADVAASVKIVDELIEATLSGAP